MNAMAESPDHESPGYSVALRSKAMVRDEVALAVAKLGVADPDLLTEQLCLLLDGAASRAQLGFTCSAVTAARTAAELLMDTALAAG
jgi:hypothetical protein